VQFSIELDVLGSVLSW